MKIILLEDFLNLGKVGDILFVKNGYARNFLIPKKKALYFDRNIFLNIFNFKKFLINNNIKKKFYLQLLYKKLNNRIFKTNKSLINLNINDIIYILKINGFKFYKNQLNLPKNYYNKLKDFVVKINIYNKICINIFIITV